MITTRRAVALLPLSVLALAACGGGDDGGADGVASLETPDAPDATTATGSSEPPTSLAPEDQMLEFAACMRENDVPMADPQVDENGRVQMQFERSDGSQEDIPQEVIDEAFTACQDLAPTGPVTGNGGEFDPTEMQDQILEFTQCMRDRGIDIDDPDFSDTGRMATPGSTPEGEDGQRGPMLAGPFGELDLSDPETEAAFNECGEETGLGLPGGAMGGGAATQSEGDA